MTEPTSAVGCSLRPHQPLLHSHTMAPTSPTQPILVTGAAGFIGSHLCRALLQRGDRVVGIDNFDSFYSRTIKQHNLDSLESDSFTFLKCDICDHQAISAAFEKYNPKTVHHLAALAGVRPSIENPARYAAVNLDGLISMLEAARHHGCRTFLFASSSSVYGNNTKVPFAEDDPVEEPISPYAATKRAGELLCHTYSRLYDISIGALRFFTVFGPAQRPDLAISKFMRMIAAGTPVPMFGDGSTSRDYTYIDDIITGVLAAQRHVENASSQFFRIWNLGGSHPVTLTEMINAICDVVGNKPRIEQLPMQPGDVQRTWADLARSEAELGYSPATSFEDGLARQWQWLQQNMQLFDRHSGNTTNAQPA